MNTQTQTIYNFSNSYCELKGLSLCFEAYAEYFAGEDVTEGGIGFNSNSGYVYIALENGMQICSMLGRGVEYLVTNLDTGEEYFFDTPQEAQIKIDTLYS
jgi:hypothetical protein